MYEIFKPNWEEMKSDLINDNLYGPDDIIEIESNEQEEQLPKINHLVTKNIQMLFLLEQVVHSLESKPHMRP